MYSHIERVLGVGFDRIEQVLELTNNMPFLNEIFNASVENDRVDGNRQMIDEIAREITGNGRERWLESIREKLRAQEKVLGDQLRKIKKACEDELDTLTSLKEKLAGYWGNDALKVACIIWMVKTGLTWAASKAGSASWSVRILIGTAKVTLGVVAQIFWDNNVSGEAEEEAGLERADEED